jgi:peptide-methionine (S)-S-oxide reductase
LGDHTEAVQLDFDPEQVSYGQLLAAFWQLHNPTRPPYSQQYRSLIVCHDSAQQAAAEGSKSQQEQQAGKIYTEILPTSEFYLAEGYHQKYYLQRLRPVYQELRARYSSLEEFLADPVVTRLNGYAAGCGSANDLQQELETFALSSRAQSYLLRHLH